MQENEQALKDDVAFVRALAEGGATGVVREGAVFVASGLIFALVALQYWAIEAGLLPASPRLRAWLWLDGALPFLVCLVVISAKCRGRPAGAASRAIAAAMSGVGIALLLSDVGLYAASLSLGIPLLIKWMFPLILFVLFGGAWSVAFAVRRRPVLGLAAGGSFAAAILCGAVMGRPEEWLVLATGLVLLVALPGGMILRADGGRR